MRRCRYALTERDVMLAHWLSLVPDHLQLAGRYGTWTVEHDWLDQRLGVYGMGRN
jgi:hypothetical protein